MKNYPNCIDCGKSTRDYKSKRCWNCYVKNQQIPKNTPNYKDGKSIKEKSARKYGTYKDRSASKEYRKNLSQALLGNIPWNKGKKGLQKSNNKGKSLEEIYGIEIAKKIKKKMSVGWTKNIKKKLSIRAKKQWKNILFVNKIKRAISEANKGRKATLETLKKMSKSMKGKNNPRYIDGRTNKWEKVRTRCFERDNYTCNLCRKRGNVYLNAHHIMSRNKCKNIFDLDNLITLCRECHLNMTNIEQTDIYDKYKERFILYVKKISE